MPQFTHLPHCETDSDATWSRCPHCGRQGFTMQEIVHLPKCPWPQLESDRLEILALREQVEMLRKVNETLRRLAVEREDDSDEPVTMDWWSVEYCVSENVCGISEGWWLELTPAGTLSLESRGEYIDLPAVRTRGDVRMLVKLLGRE